MMLHAQIASFGLFLFMLGCHPSNPKTAEARPVVCGTGSESGPCRTPSEKLTESQKRLFEAQASLRQSRTFSLPAFQRDFENLPWTYSSTTSPWPTNPKPADGQPVVLFIEPNQLPISALGRFRGNVLGRFTYDFDKKSFVQDSRQFPVPKRFNLMSELWGKYKPALEWLEDLNPADYFDPKEATPFDGLTRNYHGSFVFDLFAMRAPSAKVVFAEFPQMKDILTCHPDSSRSEAMEEIKAHLVSLKTAYQKVVTDNGVSHVVITHSYKPRELKLVLRSDCPVLERQANEVIAEIVKYNQTVFAKPDIRVFQAMSNYSDKLVTKQDWEMFCLKGENVFRTSYISSSRKDIPAYGVPMSTVNPPDGQKENWDSGCSQVVINSGFDEVMNYGSGDDDNEHNDDDNSGIYYEAVPKFSPDRASMSAPRLGAFVEHREHKQIMANSWATPIAAAMALHIEENFKKVNGRKPTVQELKSLLFGRVFDPILHKQFEVYYQKEGELE